MQRIFSGEFRRVCPGVICLQIFPLGFREVASLLSKQESWRNVLLQIQQSDKLPDFAWLVLCSNFCSQGLNS